VPDSDPRPLPKPHQRSLVRWQKTADAIAAHLAATGRMPKPSGGPAEAALARAVSDVRCRERSGRRPLGAEQREIFAAIPGWTWSTWDAGYQRAVADIAAAGSLAAAPVRTRRWVHLQRGLAAAGVLAADQVDRLALLPGPDAATGPRVGWEDRRRQLVAHLEQAGSMPSKKDPDPETRRLGQWVSTQRKRRAGYPGVAALIPEMIAALEEVEGWSWTGRMGPAAVWDATYRRLADHLAAGHPYPALGGPDDRLAQFVARQRGRHAGTTGYPLSDRQRTLLEALPGWVWRTSRSWPMTAALVAEFAERHGRLPAAGSTGIEGDLRTWVVKQERRRAATSSGPPLPPERIAVLDAIPGWTWRS
jgi:hypothetical protein